MIPYFVHKTIMLASASPRRLQLLRQIGVEPLLCPVDVVEETNLAGRSPAQLARQNARRKAAAAHAAGGAVDAVIIGADTVVVLDGRLFGKPRNKTEAAAMLRQLSGRWHSVYTGICLIDSGTGRSVCGSSQTRVRFASLSEAQISAYVASGEPLDKAGAYGIQGLGGLFVRRISGDYGTVVGLSLPLLAKLAFACGKT